MNERDTEVARLHAKLPNFGRRVAEALDIIARANLAEPYISSSLGKDSAVLTHLVLSVRPDTPVRFLRWRGETEILGNYDEVIEQWGRMGVYIEQAELNRDHWEADFVGDSWGSIRQSADGYYTGLRAEEAKGRKASLRVHGTIYKSKSGITRVCPLAWWKTLDIAAYCYMHDLPLLDAYTDHGIDARTSSGLPIHKGRESDILPRVVADLRESNPAGLAQLLLRYPELAHYK